MLEVDKCRSELVGFCVGNGVDLGFGGHAIRPRAICVEREEGHLSRAVVADPSPTHLIGDVCDLYWFADNVLDYVFSSHVLEDFADTQAVLREWVRVLKPNGYLVLFLPDQQRYVAHCQQNGSLPNQAHQHANFSLEYVRQCLPVNTYWYYHRDPVPYCPYSFELVVRKTRP